MEAKKNNGGNFCEFKNCLEDIFLNYRIYYCLPALGNHWFYQMDKRIIFANSHNKENCN